MFKKWSEERPADIHDDQVLLWRTKHVRLPHVMVMSGCIRKMHNGWKNTDHLLPPMTRWDGYRHLIPADLEWDVAPGWIKEKATFEKTDKWGGKSTYVIDHMLVRLLDIEGLEPRPCPFCGGKATWQSRDGFIGAMPHQENEFSIGCCLRTGYYRDPEKAVQFWNTRADARQPETV